VRCPHQWGRKRCQAGKVSGALIELGESRDREAASMNSRVVAAEEGKREKGTGAGTQLFSDN